MARPITRIIDSFKIFKDNVNTISVNVGDPDFLTTTTRAGQRSDSSDLVSALNEIDSDLHGAGGGDTKLDLNYLSYSELRVRDSGLVGGFNAIDAYIGGDSTTLPTDATTLVGALNEIDSDIHGASGGNVKADLTYTSYSEGLGNQHLVGAVNAIDAFIGDDSSVLPTSAKTIIRAIKELDSDLHGAGGGNAKADMDTEATTVVGAVNEIEAVFDASETQITSPSDFQTYVTGDLFFDVSGNIKFDAGGGTFTYQDDSTVRVVRTVGATNTDTVTGNYTIDASGDITLDADDADIFFKDGGVERIKNTLGATNTVAVTGDYVIDVSGDIVLDAAGDNITLKDAGTTRFAYTLAATNILDVTGNLEHNVSGSLTDSVGTNYTLVAGSAVDQTAGTTFDLTSGTDFTVTVGGNYLLTVVGNYTIDAGGDIIFDAGDDNITFRDGDSDRVQYTFGATSTIDVFGSLVNNIDGSLTDSASTSYTLVAGTTVSQTAGGTFDQISGGNFTTTVTGDFQVDASGDIILDAGGADVILRDDGTQFGRFVQSGNHLAIKSSTDDALTFNSTSAQFHKVLFTDSALGTDATAVAAAINELESAARGTNTDYALTTTAQNFRDAIREHETDIGDMTFTGLSASDISAALRELRIELGDHSTLLTDSTASAIGAINELHGDIGDIALLSVNDSEGSATTATDLVTAANYLDTRLDSVEGLLDQAVLTSSNVKFNDIATTGTISKTGTLLIDVSANITLDADGGNVYLKDGGTQFGALTNTSSNLIIKSGSTTAMTFSGANITFAGTLTPPSLNTTATDIAAAIDEHEGDIGNMSLTTTANNLTAAINELDAELGTITSAAMKTTATTVSGAIAEVHDETTTNTTNIGTLNSLEDSVYSGAKGSVVDALNAAAALLLQLDSASGFLDNVVGSLTLLSAFYDSAGVRTSVVSALNHLGSRITNVYDESGTLLNP